MARFEASGSGKARFVFVNAPPLARRFYKAARAVERDGAFGVALDERTLRTPGGAVFAAPTRALGEAVAAEWGGQGEHIVPSSMPLTQLAFAALDHTPRRRAELADYVAKFGETDLVSHRANAPAGLAARQEALWSPLLDWSIAVLGAELPVVTGVVATDVRPSELAKLRARAVGLDDFRLTALTQAAGLAGSAVIAFALVFGALTPKAAYDAAFLDDLWSFEHWGEDAEARVRLDRQRAEFENIARFIATLT